jgi:hypothetical protein
MPQNKQNQTDPAWLQGHLEQGTGLFLVPDFEAAQGAIKKVFVPNLTYQQCVERGSLAIVFKWIPDDVEPYINLLNEACGAPCVDTCTRPGCACYNGRCQ